MHKQTKEMKRILIGFILLIQFSIGYSNSIDVIIKANIIRGESMVTVNMDPSEIESIFRKEFNDVRISRDINKRLLVDVFVYQFPGDYPTIAITIRTDLGLHYYDKESIKLFGNVQNANLKIARIIASRLPKVIHLTQKYSLNLEDILFNRKSLSLMQTSSNAITKAYRNNYRNSIHWGSNEQIPFIIDDFIAYLSYCLDYQGIRKKINKQGEIVLILKIARDGRTSIIDINSPFQLKDKEKQRLNHAIAALPLWLTNEELNNIELRINLNRDKTSG